MKFQLVSAHLAAWLLYLHFHTINCTAETNNATSNLTDEPEAAVSNSSSLVKISTSIENDHTIIASLSELAQSTYPKLIPCMTKNRVAHKLDTAKWALPSDAEEHYKFLLKETEKYRNIEIHEAHGFRGPWIENLFIEKFIDKPLAYFNGMIPLFIQWVDIHCQDFKERKNASIPEHQHLPRLLMQILRMDVIYMTVSQDDQGIGIKLTSERPNILVFSAGGFGNVPIPLIMDELKYVQPPHKYRIEVGFYGSLRPRLSRSHMLNEMKSLVERERMNIQYNQNEKWLSDLLDTKFNLAPRGFGRTSYRLVEVIQSGRIPVYIYDDYEWLPYAGTNISVTEFGYSGRMGRLNSVVQQLKTTSGEDVQKREALVKAVREHYTYDGVIKQLEMFITDPFGPQGGQLRCSPVPDKDHRIRARKL